MDFNFNISTTSAVRNTRHQLAPWEIHKVKFTGMEIREFQGKKDPTQTYKMLQANFENEEGYFNVSFWYPKEGDTIRREYTRQNGSIGYMPSTFETMWATLKQTVEVLVPGGLEKLGAKLPKCKAFDDIAKVAIAITNTAKGKETNIKLIGRTRDGKIVSDIPNVVGLNSKMDIAKDSNHDQGEAFVSDNYLGDKLYFSNYEEGQRNKYLSSKPTNMKNSNDDILTSDSNDVLTPAVEVREEISTNDESIDDLLAGL